MGYILLGNPLEKSTILGFLLVYFQRCKHISWLYFLFWSVVFKPWAQIKYIRHLRAACPSPNIHSLTCMPLPTTSKCQKLLGLASRTTRWHFQPKNREAIASTEVQMFHNTLYLVPKDHGCCFGGRRMHRPRFCESSVRWFVPAISRTRWSAPSWLYVHPQGLKISYISGLRYTVVIVVETRCSLVLGCAVKPSIVVVV